jgi:hypothetical protein
MRINLYDCKQDLHHKHRAEHLELFYSPNCVSDGVRGKGDAPLRTA